jgi:hypothetical protein
MTSVIEDFDAAGVRFVFFSPQKFRRAKILAGQMGIETGWNSSISLQDRENSQRADFATNAATKAGDGAAATNEANSAPSMSEEKKLPIGSAAVAGDWHHTDDWDEKAQLPHGIKEIRNHLDVIDNVPLLVQLFTNSSPTTVREMIHVMQENGVVVCAVGSALWSENAIVFQDADIAIATDTLPTTLDRVHLDGPVRNARLPFMRNPKRSRLPSAVGSDQPVTAADQATLALSAELNCMPCALSFVEGCSIYVTVDIVAEARRLLRNSQQAFNFMRACQVFLATLMLSSHLITLPGPILSTNQVIWLMWGVVPSLSIAIIGTVGADQMRDMVPKNTSRAVLKRSSDFATHTNVEQFGSVSNQFIRAKSWAVQCCCLALSKDIDDDVLTKHEAYRYSCFAVMRLLPTVFACLIVYCWTFLDTMNNSDDSAQVLLWSSEESLYYSKYASGAWNVSQNASAGREGDALAYAEMRSRVWTQSFLVWCLVFLSLGLSSKLTSPWQRVERCCCCCCWWCYCCCDCRKGCSKRKARGALDEEDDFGDADDYRLPKHRICNYTWAFVSFVLLTAQACACAVTEQSPPRAPPIGLIVFVAVWPLIILSVDDFVKRSDRTRIKKINQRLRIMFDTKLGMYSPR